MRDCKRALGMRMYYFFSSTSIHNCTFLPVSGSMMSMALVLFLETVRGGHDALLLLLYDSHVHSGGGAS